MIDKRLVQKHFDRHAFEYDQFAHVQQQMATELYDLAAPHFPTDVQNILEIGCGTGFLTLKITEQFSAAKIALLDISREMLKQTEEKLRRDQTQHHTIEFIEADAEKWAEQATLNRFDLIASSATFQWFNKTEETIARYWHKLKPGGLLFFSTFCEQTFEELHSAFQEAEKRMNLPSQRRGQFFMTMDEWDKLFQGLAPKAKRLATKQVLQQESYDSVRHFLTHVKRVGAGNAIRNQGQQNVRAGTFSRKLFQQMEKVYLEQFGRDGKIPATYHIGYSVYQKEGEDRV